MFQMKKILSSVMLFIAVSLLSTSIFGQKIERRKVSDPEKGISSEEVYFLPEFKKGVIYFKDGQRSSGMLNVNMFFQKLYFITPEGDTLALKNNDDVQRAFAGTHQFYLINGDYNEVVDMCDDVLLCEVKRISFESEQQGAYGSTSSTTAIKKVSTYSEGGNERVFDNHATEYIFSSKPYLVKGSKRYQVTKKALLKLLPSRKNEIEQYLSEGKVDFDDIGSLRAMFASLK